MRCTPPPTCGFYFLLKKSSGNPYLKILDFSQLFITDATMEINKKLGYPRAEHFWDTQYKNI